jgi:hypothetical protein
VLDKVLANTLKLVILNVICKSRSTINKGRNFLGGILIANEVVRTLALLC